MLICPHSPAAHQGHILTMDVAPVHQIEVSHGRRSGVVFVVEPVLFGDPGLDPELSIDDED